MLALHQNPVNAHVKINKLYIVRSNEKYITINVQKCFAGQVRISVLKQLVKLEATKIFMKLIMDLQSKSVGSPDALVNELMFILGQLSQKGNKKKIQIHFLYFISNFDVFQDSKFSKHAEVLNATKSFHQHLKNNVKNVKLISPLLMCFKTLTKNGSLGFLILSTYHGWPFSSFLTQNITSLSILFQKIKCNITSFTET